MHELSIARSVLEIVRQTIPENDWKDVQTVRLKIGDVSGVVPESLDFSFSAIASDTPFVNAKLEIERVPFSLHCNKCGRQSTNYSGLIVCQYCTSMDTTILSGTELLVSEIELADHGKN